MAKQNKQKQQPIGILYGDTFNLPIGEIDLRLENHRQMYVEDRLSELKEAIINVGIINALTVIHHEGCFVLVSGWRRYKASIMAGLTEVPVRVALTDMEGAKLIQFIENCQREDIGPLEERDAFNEWIESGKKPADIAHMIGVSEKYVYQRINLNRLIADVEEAVASGGINFSVALEFCKITPDRQKDLLTLISTPNMESPYTNDIRTVRNFIASISTDLTKALFDTSDENLMENVPACISCSKRSGCMKTLFPEIVENDTCYDRECYRAKTETALGLKASEIQKAGGKVHWVSETYLNHKTAQTNGFDFCFNHLETEEFFGFDTIVDGEPYGIIKESPIHGNVGRVFRIISSDPSPFSEPKRARSATQTPQAKARKDVSVRMVGKILKEVVARQPEHVSANMLVWAGWNLLQGVPSGVAKSLAREFAMSYTMDGETSFTHRDLEEEGMDYAMLKRMYLSTSVGWDVPKTVLFINSVLLYAMMSEVTYGEEETETYVMDRIASEYGVESKAIIDEVQAETGIDLGILPF